MSITVNLRYTGTNGSARKFAEEMISSGTVELIRNEPGNLRYEYYLSADTLRKKYDLRVSAERYISEDAIPERDQAYINR